jgi:L-ascorbate metabolism protein UlaG (beta-lactamase superfamily)
MKKLILPEKRGNRYYNNKSYEHQALLAATLPMLTWSYFERGVSVPLDTYRWLEPCIPKRSCIVPTITWLGHATFLIQLGGVNILTDPVFGDAAFYKRIFTCPVARTHLPPIDILLLSHNHHDHLDEASVMSLKQYPDMRIVVPMGDKEWFAKRDFDHVEEMMWWNSVHFKKIGYHGIADITLTFLPAMHWSQRGLFDQNKSLWGSWMIEWHSHYIYFAGDTAYSSHFSLIAEQFPIIDLVLMPIGPCEPRSWTQPTHVTPQEAVQAFVDLAGYHLIPMHWGTFYQGIESFTYPIDLLQKSWKDAQSLFTKESQLHIIKQGQPVELAKNIDDRVFKITFSGPLEVIPMTPF